jgi:acetyltransferase-like isoleucine patch superfamily enzyme
MHLGFQKYLTKLDFMKNLFIFLLKKSSNVKFIDLFFVEFESLLQTFLNLFPGNFGILIRGFLYKLFIFRNCELPFIQKDVCFVHCKKITFGKNFTVNSFTYINAIGNIKFGDNVLIGPSVVISSGKHIIPSSLKPIIIEPTLPQSINVGNDVWLGANVTILPGISIADGCVIGANSVVTKSTKKNGIYAGNPARLIRLRK